MFPASEILTSTASCGKPRYLNLMTSPGDKSLMDRTGTVGKVLRFLLPVWNKTTLLLFVHVL